MSDESERVALRAGRRDDESLNARANWPVETWLRD